MANATQDLLDQPYVIEYYYTARWGHADEFIELFKKNHLPVLLKQVAPSASSIGTACF